jgi:hypothetical protein
VTLAVGFMAPDSAFGGKDTTPPELKSLSCTPASIDNQRGCGGGDHHVYHYR